MPALDQGARGILQMDFIGDSINYAIAVRDYVFEGNIRGGDVDGDFDLFANSIGRDWFHAPWQHWGGNGREGYHGLIREGPLSKIFWTALKQIRPTPMPLVFIMDQVA